MTELQQILSAHAAKYPAMRPQDAVKLIYQQEFGGGHLISDANQSLNRLLQELPDAPTDAPLLEDIGNGMLRVHLGALERECVSPESLNAAFVRSANAVRGDQSEFLNKLRCLQEITAAGAMPFELAALNAYLQEYAEAGYPMVSHSEVFREAYHPAYRVALERTLLPAFERRICRLAASGKRVIAAIDGRCASGKSTVGEALSRKHGWALFHMDDFFPRPEQRTPERYATPGENVDWERFLEEILLPLRRGDTEITYHPFDCQTFTLAEPLRVEAGNVVLVEGSYSCQPNLFDLYDVRAFFTISREMQRERILLRNGERGLQAFEERWIPLEEKYFAAMDVSARADFDIEM